MYLCASARGDGRMELGEVELGQNVGESLEVKAWR